MFIVEQDLNSIPKFPSYALMLVGVTAVAIAGIFYKKKLAS